MFVNVKQAQPSFYRWAESPKAQEQEGESKLKTGLTWMHRAAWGVLLLSGGMLGWASGVHTNPLNNDPLVRAAYEHFYNLDYPGAVERLVRFHAAHPGDPQGTVLLLEAVVFQELYRQDLLDTTFYANDGFLTGRHATAEDPAIRDRILSLADEAVQEADWRIGRNPNDVDALYARGWTRARPATSRSTGSPASRTRRPSPAERWCPRAPSTPAAPPSRRRPSNPSPARPCPRCSRRATTSS